jgi:hypothetical protein
MLASLTHLWALASLTHLWISVTIRGVSLPVTNSLTLCEEASPSLPTPPPTATNELNQALDNLRIEFRQQQWNLTTIIATMI